MADFLCNKAAIPRYTGTYSIFNSTLQGFDNGEWLTDTNSYFVLCPSPKFKKHDVSKASSASVCIFNHFLSFLWQQESKYLDTVANKVSNVPALDEGWMNTEHWWNNNWQKKTTVLGQKPVPMALCPPQIPQGMN